MKNIIFLLFLSITLYGQTIKDISNIVGIRENQLIGHGLVVGLEKGDSDEFTNQSLKNLLRNSYIGNNEVEAKSVASVIVTAMLPPFARQGDKITVNVSTIGSAKSLEGGQLLLTQLKGIDGKVYAVAQGSLILKNLRKGSKFKKNAFIYDGATIENELSYSLRDEKSIVLSLLKHDATIAALCEEKINEEFGTNIAYALDTRTIEIEKPKDMSIIRFISKVQNIKLDTIMKKKILIDPVREIIIAGADITISPITIVRKKFTLRIKKSTLNDKDWNNPAKNRGVDIGDDTKFGDDPAVINLDNALLNTKNIPTISDLMRALKVLEIDIGEIIETIKMLDELGAIDADVEIVR